MSRRFILLLISSLVGIGFLYAFTRTVATSINLIRWQTDTDFNKGSFSSTEVSGINDAAVLQIAELADETNDIDYETSGQYVASSTNIVVTGGAAKLIGLSGDTTTYPFTSAGNYTLINSTEIEVTGGVVQLKEVPISRVGHWPLNESAGTNVPDISDNDADGTTINMEDGDWVSAKLNNGLLFDGVDEYVNLGDIADFERTDPFSLEMWFKTTTAAAEMMLTRQLNASTFRGWNLFIEGGKIKTSFISDNAALDRIFIETNGTFNNDEFRHLVLTYDGSSDTSGMTIYIDGFVEATTILTNNLTGSISVSTDTLIAARGGTINFTGIVDEVIIYDIELTAANVTTRFNSGTGIEDPVTDGTFFTNNPTVSNATGFDFSSVFTSFIATEILAAGTSIQYVISSDTGTTFNFF